MITFETLKSYFDDNSISEDKIKLRPMDRPDKPSDK